MKQVLTKYTCNRCGSAVECGICLMHDEDIYHVTGIPSGWLCVGRGSWSSDEHLCPDCAADYMKFKDREEKCV